MKITIALTYAIALAGSIHAERLTSGLEFRAPEGWTVKTNDQAAVLLPPDMAMEPDGKEPSELYIVGHFPGVKDLQDPKLVSMLQGQYFPAEAQVRSAGAPQTFRTRGGTGYLHRYDAVSQGVGLRMEFYLAALPNGGAAVLVAAGRPELVARRGTTIAQVAGSFSRQATAAAPVAQNAVPPSGPQAAQWDQRLRGRKLYRFSGYSSSYGSGGSNSQTTLLLAGDGMYQYNRSSSVSIYVDGATAGSASRDSNQGRWRIYEQGGKPFLELIASGGGSETIALSLDGTKTLLNGQRWLVGD